MIRSRGGWTLQFEALYVEYYPVLCRFANRYIADRSTSESLVQNVFSKIWERPEVLEDIRSVINYLLTITRNECIDHLRKMRYTTPMSTLSEQQLWMIEERLHSLEVLEAPNPMEEDIIFKLERALSDLPPRQQQILRMYRFEGQSYKEIADQLQISPRTVEAQLRIAMKKLRESMPLMLLIWWKLLS